MIEGLIFFGIGSVAYLLNKIAKLSNENREIKTLLIQKTYSTNQETDTANADFLKFVSDSREMAFEYIEEVQDGLKKFIDAVDKDISYFDKYGDAISTPLSKPMQSISLAYKDLKKLLPEDNNA